jgi:hypothetical protein
MSTPTNPMDGLKNLPPINKKSHLSALRTLYKLNKQAKKCKLSEICQYLTMD